MLRSRELPSVSANGTLAKRSHRFISRPGLGLAVADLLLTALSAGQAGADTPLGLGNHGLVHILLLQLLVLGTLLVTFEFFVSHLDEAVGLDGARKDVFAKSGIGLVLEVLEERAQTGFVFLAGFGLVCVIGCELHFSGHGKDVIRDCDKISRLGALAMSRQMTYVLWT